MFYLCEEHEIRSNVSSTHEYFKNKDYSNVEEHIKNRKEFKDYKLISTENTKLILSNMYRIYPFFDSVLDDFIKNVILSQNSDLVSVFNKEFQWIKKRASECCRKMLSISFNFHTNESDIILIDSKVMNRDIKINLILDRKIK